MKRILYAIFLSGIGFLNSCTDEAINLEQKDAMNYEVVFSTPTRCELSIVGCYDAAQSGY